MKFEVFMPVTIGLILLSLIAWALWSIDGHLAVLATLAAMRDHL